MKIGNLGSDVKHSISEEPAFEWARSGNYYSLSEFLREGGDVNCKNLDGHSLLTLAACNNRWGLSAWLIKNNADVNSIDLSGNSVLMSTCLKGHTRIVKMLLHAGADPFLQNAQGRTALDFARSFEHEDIVEVLAGGRVLH
jgi:ankyrin repeat protein